MASAIDICNLALARLGDNATLASIDPPEGSAQAEHCARFYPIARDSLLEMHPWRFATRRVQLALLAGTNGQWDYVYARPNGALKILAVLADDRVGSAYPYEAESRDDGSDVICTIAPFAWVRYTARITDTDRYPPLFVDALAWLLASHLAGPVIKGDVGSAMSKSCLQQFSLALSLAKTADSNQRQGRPDHTPAWIRGR